MNKYEEALKDILDSQDFEYSGESVYLMQVLVKRATPMKPHFTMWDYKCSNCGSLITNGKKWQCEKYCDECGQAIDWSEENE